MATKNTWQRADEIMAGECERMFQNGGPRVYTYEAPRFMPSGMSATRTVQCAFPGTLVYARRNVEGRYRWMVAGLRGAA